MPLAGLALLLVALVSGAGSAAAKDVLEYSWIELRTPHFVVASAQDPDRTQELAVDLEHFRSVAELLTNIGRFEERIPTKIYLLPKAESDLGFDRSIAGYFSGGMRANYAVIIPSGSSDEALKHEYVHFLIHNRDRLMYPTWFDEGFADLLATLSVKDGTTFEYGRPGEARLAWLMRGNWLSSGKVLRTRDTKGLRGERLTMFYAQSWLLVHYLMLGRPEFPSRNADFLRRRERGEDVQAAFESAFGVKTRSLSRKLKRYARSLHYVKGTLPQPLPPVETSSRPLARAEIAAELGILALRTRGAGAAQTYYEAALAADANYGPALTGVADLHKVAGRFEEAKPLYEKAIALEPTNENHELDYAEYFLALARKDQTEKSAEPMRKHLVEARRHFARAYKLNPDNPEVLAMNGATYLFEGEDPARGVESLEAAHALLPAQVEIRQLLARGYIAAGEPEKARQQLETLLAWAHSDGAQEIRELLDSLDAAGGSAGSRATAGDS